MAIKREVLIDKKFLVRVLDEKRLAYVPIQCRLGTIVVFNPADMRVIECETLGLVPLVEHGDEVRELLRAQI